MKHNVNIRLWFKANEETFLTAAQQEIKIINAVDFANTLACQYCLHV